MVSNKYFVFVTLDGLSDPLGQSQILPYLIGLSKIGYKISIVSCEKNENLSSNINYLNEILSLNKIKWKYCVYNSKVPFISQRKNYQNLKRLVGEFILEYKKNVVLHCRSYISALIGLYYKRKLNTGFIFDMRGFWADERIEGKIWSMKNPITNALYRYFKNQEKSFFKESDQVVSLTQSGKEHIEKMGLNIRPDKISVIPCCADLNHFSNKSINLQLRNELKDKFHALQNNFIISYVGSLGTWYMTDEMLDFFKIFSTIKPATLFIISKDNPEIIYKAARSKGIDTSRIIVSGASRKDIPTYISLSDVSIFFIRPTFSKIASSPTKMGELLAMGIPVITNTKIGDTEQIIRDSQCGIIISQFNENEYQKISHEVIEKIDNLKQNTQSSAGKYFSLEEGLKKYNSVYSKF